MSTLTNFLKLFKWNTDTDADKEFDVEKALNQNWDKVDAGYEELSKNKLNTSDLGQPTTGSNITLTDAVDSYANVNKVYGKTTEAGTGEKSSTNPYTITNAGDNGKIQVKSYKDNVAQADVVSITVQDSLKSIEDIKDTIENNTTTRYLDAVTLTGTETVSLHMEQASTNSYFVTVGKDNIKIGSKIISSHFRFDSSLVNNDVEHMRVNASNKFIIFVNKTIAPDVASFKSWLANNNVKIIYERNTIVTEQISPIKKLKTYKDTTHILADTDVEISYVKNTSYGNLVLDVEKLKLPTYIGSQILHVGLNGNALVAKTGILGVYNYGLIDGIFSGITIPTRIS